MPRVRFTQYMQRFVSAPECEVSGATVREALEDVFTQHAALRSYILDDQSALRRHVAIFVNGAQILDRAAQSDPVASGDEIMIMQALSGG